MENIIIIAILIVIVGSVSFYIYKEKKSGKTCIGCPYADTCGTGGSSCGGCGGTGH
ncbi:MAG: FeoB-associated Cys-rich membrane protein [Lachnospiraceae bacterium]|nr:FeoB-associated Cys-rich membrane protein [Lachnospiraceae bacterium]